MSTAIAGPPITHAPTPVDPAAAEEAADQVVVGIGVVPRDDLARHAHPLLGHVRVEH